MCVWGVGVCVGCKCMWVCVWVYWCVLGVQSVCGCAGVCVGVQVCVYICVIVD